MNQIGTEIHETLTQTARRYLGYNLSVIPTLADKRPALSKWKPYQTVKLTEIQAEDFFSSPGVKGIGIICGQISGNLEVLDIDCKNDRNGTLWYEFCQLIKGSLPSLIPGLVIAKTINNGYHIYYRCEQIEGNSKLANNARQEVLIETRGEGGYVIASPSPGYNYIQGNPGKIRTITQKERSILLSIAKSFDETPCKMQSTKPLSDQVSGNSAFEDYNRSADVVGLLEKHGWRAVRQQGERIHLVRPGKTDNSISGNFHTGKRIFFPFTTSTIFEACKGYNPVQVYATLETNGNLSMASEQLYSAGYGVRYSNKQDYKPTNENTPMPVQPTQLLPIEGFPPILQEIITSCSMTYGTPRDYWAGAVLIATALAIGDKLELVTNYRNVPVLWLVLVGDVSSGKSNPIDFCLNYFKKLDSESIRKYVENSNEYNRIIKMTIKDRQTEGIMEKPQKPECFQYILNDFTPEAMVTAHQTNDRGLLIERDELKGWIDDFGRYSKSGEQSNMLTSWSRIGITYNRKTSGIMNIPRPCILVCGGMQPDLLHTLAADNRAENGFLSRLCAVYPDHTEKGSYNNATLPDKIRTDWEKFLSSLTNMQTPLKIRLSEEAQQQYAVWFDQNVKKTNEESSGYLKGVYGKLDIISLRLAIIIRGMNMVCNGEYSEEVTDNEMGTAIALTEYFRTTALKVYRRIFDNNDLQGIDKKLVASFLFKEVGANKTDIAKLLKTSRSQLDRALEG